MRVRRWQQSILATVCLFSASAFGQTPPKLIPDDAKANEAQAFLDTWTEKGRALCEDNANGCAASGLSLVRAAELFQEAHQRNKAITTRMIILDPRYHLDYTEYGKKTLLAVSEDFKAIAEYDRSAGYLESLVSKFPAMEEAPVSLTDAVVFRFALGDIAAAHKDVELYAKNYGSKRPAELTRLYLATALWHEEKREQAESKKWIKANMAFIDKNGVLDTKVRAHALLGRLLSYEGDAKGATAEYQIVLASLKDPMSVVKELRGSGSGDEAEIRRLVQVLTVWGEALFFMAEQKRADVDAIRFPEYKGPGDTASVLKHINTKVKDWMEKKRAAIEVAERAYMAIPNLQPAPPPRWVVASAARVGQLWGKFSAEFRAAPIPKEWRTRGLVPNTTITFEEVRNLYYTALDEASEPVRNTAKTAFESCQKNSVRFQWYDEYSRSCDQWLAKHDRKRHIPVEEFVPKMVGSSFRIDVQPAPEPPK